MPIEPSTFDSNGAMNGEMFHVKQLLRRREKGADAPGGHATGLPDYARVSPLGSVSEKLQLVRTGLQSGVWEN